MIIKGRILSKKDLRKKRNLLKRKLKGKNIFEEKTSSCKVLDLEEHPIVPKVIPEVIDIEEIFPVPAFVYLRKRVWKPSGGCLDYLDWKDRLFEL